MNKVILLIFIAVQSYAQFDLESLDKLYKGEIIDTTVSNELKLYKNFYPYYYEFDAKYPESSQTLLANCQSFLSRNNIKIKGSGYLTFKFMIDNEGKVNYTKFTQLDENYKLTKFNKNAINAIYEYIKTLDKWKKVLYEDDENTPISYISFISFKIENEKIINIIP